MRYQMVYCTLKNLPVAKTDRNSSRTKIKAVEQNLLHLKSFQNAIVQQAIKMNIQEKFPSNIAYEFEEVT